MIIESIVDIIGFFVFDDFEYKFGGDGKEVNFVCEIFGGLDSGNIGVDEDGVDIFFF